jgi:hypothetical protein
VDRRRRGPGDIRAVVEEPMASFEADIRPLFREQDRLAMDFVLDLWSHADVTERSQSIRQRLADGSMPCDGPWDPARIAIFDSWVEHGCPP